MALYRSERNPLLTLEKLLAENTTLRTQKITHRNIICIGSDLLKEIESYMNSDKNEAVKKAIIETEEKLLEERNNIIYEITNKLKRENEEAIDQIKQLAEKELEIVKYRCEVAEKKRERLAQQKFEREKQEALQNAAEEWRKCQEKAVTQAECRLREILLAEAEVDREKAIQDLKDKMEEEGRRKIQEAVRETQEKCERLAAKKVAELDRNQRDEMELLKERLKDITDDFQRQKNEKEEYENLFVELREDYKRFQNYTQGYCSDYLMK